MKTINFQRSLWSSSRITLKKHTFNCFFVPLVLRQSFRSFNCSKLQNSSKDRKNKNSREEMKKYILIIFVILLIRAFLFQALSSILSNCLNSNSFLSPPLWGKNKKQGFKVTRKFPQFLNKFLCYQSKNAAHLSSIKWCVIKWTTEYIFWIY